MIESSGMVQTKTATLFQDGCCLLMLQHSVGVIEKVAPTLLFKTKKPGSSLPPYPSFLFHFNKPYGVIEINWVAVVEQPVVMLVSVIVT